MNQATTAAIAPILIVSITVRAVYYTKIIGVNKKTRVHRLHDRLFSVEIYYHQSINDKKREGKNFSLY